MQHFADTPVAWSFVELFATLLERRDDPELRLLVRRPVVWTLFLTQTVDLVFLDRTDHVVAVTVYAEAWRRYSVEGANSCLLLPAGTVHSRGIEPGDQLSFDASEPREAEPEPQPATFFVDGIATIHSFQTSDHSPARVIERVGLAYPSPRAEVVAGPPKLLLGEPAAVRLRFQVAEEFGPGTIEREHAWIEQGGKPLGSLEVKRVFPVGADPDVPNSWRDVAGQVLDATRTPGGSVTCPACHVTFHFDDRWAWTGVRHRPCDRRLRLVNVEQQLLPIWCLAGNMIDERHAGPGGIETWHGSKHFSPGTKLYCYPPLWDGYENVKVMGLARASRRWITIVIRSKWIVNRRAQLVYKPAVVDKLAGYWDGTETSRTLAESLARFPV